MLALALALACSPAPAPEAAPPPAPAPAAPAPSPEEAALVQARAAADDLGKTLRGRLQGAMAEGGPAAAVRVCADEAQGLAAQVAGRHQASVGRSSLRLRNPADAPPPWVAAWLAEQGERPAQGVAGFERVEEGRARVLRPIAVDPPCLACHGSPEALAPEVVALLGERYPADAATGYAAGALRGALWAEVPVGP